MTKTIVTIEVEAAKIIYGCDLALIIEQARYMVEYNMGPEPARSTSGPIYEHLDRPIGKQIGTWTVKLGSPEEATDGSAS